MKPSLADGRIGEHALDVDGRDCNRGREEKCDAANDGDHEQRFGAEDRVATADEVHAGSNHRCRMHERRNRRRAFHRVWKPHVERELGAFATHPQKMPTPATIKSQYPQ